MFLLVLDKSPNKAARLIPDRLKFKQLLELCQLICSAGFCNLYKKVNQGKDLQQWVKKNPTWVKTFGWELLEYCRLNINLNYKTYINIKTILQCLGVVLWVIPIKTAIFRYVKEYSEFTEYETNSELPIDIAVSEYNKYLDWKENLYEQRRIKKTHRKIC